MAGTAPRTFALKGAIRRLVEEGESLHDLLLDGFEIQALVDMLIIARCVQTGAAFELTGDSGTFRMTVARTNDTELAIQWKLWVAENAYLHRDRPLA